MAEQSSSAADDDTVAWSANAARVRARLRSEREATFFRIVSSVHAFSAFIIIGSNFGVFMHVGVIRWPWWYSCMLAAAAILPIVSGVSGWLRKTPPIYLFFLASVSIVLPLLFGGYFRSPIMWANVAVICALVAFVYRRSRDNG